MELSAKVLDLIHGMEGRGKKNFLWQTPHSSGYSVGEREEKAQWGHSRKDRHESMMILRDTVQTCQQPVACHGGRTSTAGRSQGRWPLDWGNWRKGWHCTQISVFLWKEVKECRGLPFHFGIRTFSKKDHTHTHTHSFVCLSQLWFFALWQQSFCYFHEGASSYLRESGLFLLLFVIVVERILLCCPGWSQTPGLKWSSCPKLCSS